MSGTEVLLYDLRGDVEDLLIEDQVDVGVQRKVSDFIRHRPNARVGVIAIRDQFDRRERRLLRQALAQPALGPTVVVAPMSEEIVRRLVTTDASPDHIIWNHELPHALLEAVRAALDTDILVAFADGLRRLAGIPPVVATAVARTAGALPPPRTRRAMAKAGSVPESTLRYEWRRSLVGTPWEFLRWVRLVRGARIRHGSVAAAAAWLDLDERTVRRHISDVFSPDDDRHFPAYDVVRAKFVEWGTGVIRSNTG